MFTPPSINAERTAHTVAMEEEPLDSKISSDEWCKGTLPQEEERASRHATQGFRGRPHDARAVKLLCADGGSCSATRILSLANQCPVNELLVEFAQCQGGGNFGSLHVKVEEYNGNLGGIHFHPNGRISVVFRPSRRGLV